MKLLHTITLGVLAFGLAHPALAQGHDHHKHRQEARGEAHADHMLESYSEVASALYKDDLAGARKAAAGMVKHDKDSAMAKPARAIADSQSLDEARKHFQTLSEVAVPIARTENTMHVAHCPMARNGKGADWLNKA